jgi:hypothetical protein
MFIRLIDSHSTVSLIYFPKTNLLLVLRLRTRHQQRPRRRPIYNVISVLTPRGMNSVAHAHFSFDFTVHALEFWWPTVLLPKLVSMALK